MHGAQCPSQLERTAAEIGLVGAGGAGQLPAISDGVDVLHDDGGLAPIPAAHLTVEFGGDTGVSQPPKQQRLPVGRRCGASEQLEQSLLPELDAGIALLDGEAMRRESSQVVGQGQCGEVRGEGELITGGIAEGQQAPTR